MRDEVLTRIVAAQERALYGCTQIFLGLSASSDPEVVLVSEQALDALTQVRDTLEAYIDSIDAIKH